MIEISIGLVSNFLCKKFGCEDEEIIAEFMNIM